MLIVVVNYYFAILMMTQNGSVVVELSLLIWTQLFGLLVVAVVVDQFVAAAAPLFSSLSYSIESIWVTTVICAKKTTTKTPDETLFLYFGSLRLRSSNENSLRETKSNLFIPLVDKIRNSNNRKSKQIEMKRNEKNDIQNREKIIILLPLCFRRNKI